MRYADQPKCWGWACTECNRVTRYVRRVAHLEADRLHWVHARTDHPITYLDHPRGYTVRLRRHLLSEGPVDSPLPGTSPD